MSLTHSSRSSLATQIAILCAAAFLAWRAWELRFFCDDGGIIFRYAKHLSEGLGLRYNPAGPPVQGCTELPWTACLAVGFGLGFDPEQVVPVIGVLLAVVALLLAFSLTRALRIPAAAGVLVTAALAVNHSFVAWATSGLGAKWYTVMVLLAFRALAREWSEGRSPRTSPWLFGLVAISRPEGALLGVLAALAHGWNARMITRAWSALWPLLVCAGSVLVIQRLYFGIFFANSVHAKVTGFWFSRGWWWLGLFMQVYFAPLIWALGACTFLPRRHTGIDETGALFAQRAIFAIALVHTAALVSIGGDRFEFRLFDALLPLYYATAAAGACRLLELGSRTRWLAIAGWVALVFLPISSASGTWRREGPGVLAGDLDTIESMTVLYQHQSRLGRLLKAHLEPHHRIAVVAAGAAPFRSELHTLDVLGLNDAPIAARPIQKRGNLGHEKHALPEDYARETIDFVAVEFLELHPAILLARDIPGVLGADPLSFARELHPDRMPSTTHAVLARPELSRSICIRVEPSTWLYLKARTNPDRYRKRFAERGYVVLF